MPPLRCSVVGTCRRYPLDVGALTDGTGPTDRGGAQFRQLPEVDRSTVSFDPKPTSVVQRNSALGAPRLHHPVAADVAHIEDRWAGSSAASWHGARWLPLACCRSRGLPEKPVISGAEDAALKSMQDCADKLEWNRSAWNCVQRDVGGDAFYIGATALAYAATSIVVGGVIGAFIFGCYWVVTSVLFGMHQDAFSALAIKDYKNFLRMKFEKDQLTIYPIAIDRIPRAKEWRAWNRKDEKDAELKHKPLLVTDSDLNPRLIEDPIEIKKGAPPVMAQMSQKGN